MRTISRLVVAAIVLSSVVGCGGAVATAAPAPAAPAGPAQELAIVARDVAFQPASLGAESGVPLRVTFDQQDTGIPHNLALYAGPDLSDELAKTPIVSEPTLQVLDVPGLIPGRYQFRCEVHPNMATDLAVGT